MQFEYYKKESIIYDRMQLPRIVFLKLDGDEESTYGVSKKDLRDFSNRDHVAFIESMQSRLSYYEKSIRQFYADEFMSDYDFFQLLTKAFPFFGYDSLEAYLADLETVEDALFKKRLVQSLLAADKEILYIEDDTMHKEAEAIVSSRGEEITFIRNLATEERYRFNLLMMLEDPKAHLKGFKALMETLKPLYDEAYAEHASLIKACETTLKNTLEKQGEKGFDNLTQGFVSKEFLDSEKNRYLISIVFSYSFMIVSGKGGSFIVSGIHMDEGFENLVNKHETHVESQTKLFKNFADKTRYEVLRKIASGTTSTKQIAEDLGVSSATISYHINAFVTTNILKPSPKKRKKYDINFTRLEEAYQALVDDLSGK
ncbi:MAG: ArsR/SmtB family transcription factor [Bacillota bacterium]